MNKENIALSTLDDLKRLEKVISPVCNVWVDCEKMLKIEEEIKQMQNDPSIDAESLMQMGCRLSNCYNQIMNHKKNLMVMDPTRRVAGYEARFIAKNEIWEWIYKSFHSEQALRGSAQKAMSFLLMEKYR